SLFINLPSTRTRSLSLRCAVIGLSCASSTIPEVHRPNPRRGRESAPAAPGGGYGFVVSVRPVAAEEWVGRAPAHPEAAADRRGGVCLKPALPVQPASPRCR